MDLSGRFMEGMRNVDKQAALGGKHTIIHVGNKLSFRFREIILWRFNFTTKRKRIPYNFGIFVELWIMLSECMAALRAELWKLKRGGTLIYKRNMVLYQ